MVQQDPSIVYMLQVEDSGEAHEVEEDRVTSPNDMRMPEGTGKIEFDLKKLKDTLQQVGLSRGLTEEMLLVVELSP
jgi:hypothetical protein